MPVINQRPTEWSSKWFNDLLTDTDKLMDILDEKNDIVDRQGAEELLDCKGHIEFKNGKWPFLSLQSLSSMNSEYGRGCSHSYVRRGAGHENFEGVEEGVRWGIIHCATRRTCGSSRRNRCREIDNLQ